MFSILRLSAVVIIILFLAASQVQSANVKPNREVQHFVELGQMLEFNASLDAARKAYLRAALLEPASIDAHKGVYRVSVRMGDTNQAIKELKTIMQIDTNNVEDCLALAALLRQEGKAKEAVIVLQNELSSHKKNMDIQRELAFTLLQAGDAPSAAEQFKQLIELQPRAAENYVGLAISEFREGDKVSADIHVHKVLELSPNEPNALCLLGDLALSKGDDEAAISSYRKAIAAQPNLSKPYLSLGNVYLQANDTASAQQLFEDAKQNCSPEPDIFIGLAVIEERANHLDKAAEYYQQAAVLEHELERKNDIYRRLKELKKLNLSPINNGEPDQAVIKQPK